MKRFASHYLFLSGWGFLKLHAVEINREGVVQSVFPLTEEVESVEWMAGVIGLLSAEEVGRLGAPTTPPVGHPSFPEGGEGRYNWVFRQCPAGGDGGSFKGEDFFEGEELYACLFYPFDFTSMQPAAGTRHRLLR